MIHVIPAIFFPLIPSALYHILGAKTLKGLSSEQEQLIRKRAII